MMNGRTLMTLDLLDKLNHRVSPHGLKERRHLVRIRARIADC